jgi:hypothetical protein
MVDPLLITPDEVRSVQSFKVGATDWPVRTHERMPAGDPGSPDQATAVYVCR